MLYGVDVHARTLHAFDMHTHFVRLMYTRVLLRWMCTRAHSVLKEHTHLVHLMYAHFAHLMRTPTRCALGVHAHTLYAGGARARFGRLTYTITIRALNARSHASCARYARALYMHAHIKRTCA